MKPYTDLEVTNDHIIHIFKFITNISLTNIYIKRK